MMVSTVTIFGISEIHLRRPTIFGHPFFTRRYTEEHGGGKKKLPFYPARFPPCTSV
jgi:hypothetical protein